MRKILLFFRPLAIAIVLLLCSGFVMGQVPNAWINEIHYDNTGTDANEAIEVVVENPESWDLTLLRIDFYNLTGGATYLNNTLDSYTVGDVSGSLTVYSKLVPEGIQNGPQDGMALSYNGVLIQFLSYDGVLTALNGPAIGITSTDIGVVEAGTDALGESLQLSGTGLVYSDFTWQPSAIATFGSLNTGQIQGTPSSDPTITVMPSSLIGFSYFAGSGPSSEKSFMVSGAGLTDDISIAATTNYEISSDNISYQLTPIILTHSGGTVNSTTIYTRLKSGLIAGTYDEDITASSTDADPKTLRCSGSVISPTTVIINEVDSDTDGTDVLEFIELYDGGAGNTSLDGLVLVLYNGSDDLSYASLELDGKTTDANGYFVVGNSGVTNVGLVFNNGTLQNGADAVALYYGAATDFPSGTLISITNLIDAIVYDTDDADDAELLVLLNASESQINENGRGNKEFHSNQRFPNGSGGARNTSSYDQTYPTPGAANKGNATWTGASNHDWATAANWNNGLPNADVDVTIPSGLTYYPTISAAANCNNILIENGASLIGAENLTVGGISTMQRSIPGYTLATNGWHLLSSPVATFNITGSDFQPGTVSPNLDDFYGWSEVDYMWLNYKATGPSQMGPGAGYLVSYETTSTKDFVGAFNSKNVTHTDLSKTADKGNGWHLLGNPFQSALHWTNAGGTWNPVGLATGAKIMNSGGNYTDIIADGVNQYIPANQGFFVQAEDVLNRLTIPLVERVHNATSFFKSELANILTLKASDGDFYVETWIQIMDGATLGFDAAYDMNFLAGMQNAPYLYSAISETTKLSTNRIAPVETFTEVPLAFKSFLDKDFTISTTNANSFESDIDVYLKDKVANISVNLKETFEYTFTATAGELTDRFVIQLFKSSTNIHSSVYEGVQIFSNGEQVFLRSDKNSTAALSVYNMLGQEVYFKKIVLGGLQTLDLKEKAGCYIVQLVGEQGVVKEKVFIK